MLRITTWAAALAAASCSLPALASGLSQDGTVWHVRAALNVAALACRDDPGIAAGYNAMLRRDGDVLARANAGLTREYVNEAAHDHAMTSLYNHYADPTGHDAFCQEAAQVLDEARGVQPAQFAGFAEDALPRLENALASGSGYEPEYGAPRMTMALNTPARVAPQEDQPFAGEGDGNGYDMPPPPRRARMARRAWAYAGYQPLPPRQMASRWGAARRDWEEDRGYGDPRVNANAYAPGPDDRDGWRDPSGPAEEEDGSEN